MRDIDTFKWTSILENAKNWHENLRISKKLSKITGHFHNILQILLIFLYVETSNVPNNKDSYTKRIADMKKVLNISVVKYFIRLKKKRLT